MKSIKLFLAACLIGISFSAVANNEKAEAPKVNFFKKTLNTIKKAGASAKTKGSELLNNAKDLTSKKYDATKNFFSKKTTDVKNCVETFDSNNPWVKYALGFGGAAVVVGGVYLYLTSDIQDTADTEDIESIEEVCQ